MYCKKKGHIIDECYKLQNKNKATKKLKGKQPINSSEVSVVEDDHNEGELFLVSYGNYKSSEEWVLDYGCTFHMCPNWEWFSTYEMCQKAQF